MKKIASVLLMSLLLFNWFGYNLVVNYLQQQSDNHLEALLDDKLYDDSQLIELKIATHLPYQTSWASFERYDGEVEINGLLYKYVKRKLANDTLYLMCIPNTKKMNLETARGDFFKDTNELAQNNTPGKSSKSSFKNTMSDFEAHLYSIHLTAKEIFIPSREFNYQSNPLLSSPHLSPGQPPDGSLS